MSSPVSASPPAMTPQQARLSAGGLADYRRFAVGDSSLIFWGAYETSQLLLGNLPGILGYGLRALVFPPLFGSCGNRPALGRGIILRNPRRIFLGTRVMVDDYAVMDVRGVGEIRLGDRCSVGRFSTISAKEARISLGAGVNVGSYSRIASQSAVQIEESVLISAFCYIGPGNHQEGTAATPLIAREMELRGGVVIKRHAWIGAHSTILDGVTIGEGAIVGAHSLVREDVPDRTVVAGTPARVIRSTNNGT